MKTPLNKLIDFLDREEQSFYFSEDTKIGIRTAMDKAKQLLEEEKQVIKDAYYSGKDYYERNTIDSETYYNETFKNE